MAKSKSVDTEQTFESALTELETIVKKLENGDIELEAAIEQFQLGIELAGVCHQKLDAAEKRMTKIVQENGELFDFEIEE